MISYEYTGTLWKYTSFLSYFYTVWKYTSFLPQEHHKDKLQSCHTGKFLLKYARKFSEVMNIIRRYISGKSFNEFMIVHAKRETCKYVCVHDTDYFFIGGKEMKGGSF